MSAAKEIEELVAEWKWEEVSSWCTDKRIKWTVVPAEGQHQNGLSESLVKSVKRSIKHKIGENVLSFAELQTAMFEIADQLELCQDLTLNNLRLSHLTI